MEWLVLRGSLAMDYRDVVKERAGFSSLLNNEPTFSNLFKTGLVIVFLKRNWTKWSKHSGNEGFEEFFKLAAFSSKIHTSFFRITEKKTLEVLKTIWSAYTNHLAFRRGSDRDFRSKHVSRETDFKYFYDYWFLNCKFDVDENKSELARLVCDESISFNFYNFIMDNFERYLKLTINEIPRPKCLMYRELLSDEFFDAIDYDLYFRLEWEIRHRLWFDLSNGKIECGECVEPHKFTCVSSLLDHPFRFGNKFFRIFRNAIKLTDNQTIVNVLTAMKERKDIPNSYYRFGRWTEF